ncbi:MAG TPA: choice-of-anchor tandem repeat GloVer-containing protein [Terriglobia bacterium]|nr:choice-of-anchor tandem repeat GloVer-containing protein [Terriglobia bacterium]
MLSAAAVTALPAQTFKTLHSFDNTDGAFPYWAPLQATDGNLYGTTPFGGINGYGTIFRITPSGTLTTLYTFCSQRDCLDGGAPEAGLVQAADGDFYGVAAGGGADGYGTVFKFTLSGKLTTIHNFQETDGSGPYTALIQATDGNFYGTTCCGGANGFGTVFKMTPGGRLTTLHSFDNFTDGGYPYAGLLQASDGNLYGATASGGPNEAGTIFKISPTGTFATLYFFCSQNNCTDGASPYGALVQAPNGSFYGTTYYGGAYNSGTVFKFTLSGMLTTLHNFCSQSGCADGQWPEAPLVQATDGNFYGTSRFGGASDSGTVFKVSPTGKLTSLYSFCSQSGCSDGAYPYAGLIQDTNGKFYGTACGTSCGGQGNGYGTVYSESVGLGPFVETEPTSGTVGAPVKILGSNLMGATSVTFNGVAAVFKVVSSSFITTSVPTGATSGKVKVTLPSGTLTSNLPFRVRP